MANRRNPNSKTANLEATLNLLTPQFSKFRFNTNLMDEDFARIEKAGRVQLDTYQRAAIEQSLREFEFFRRLDAQGYGEKFRGVLKKLEAALTTVVLIAKTLDNLPGHLWSLIGDGTLLADEVIRNLEARRNRLTLLTEFGQPCS